MKHWLILWTAIGFCLVAFPSRSPAPLIYRPEEGWVYEKPGEDKGWMKTRAQDQLAVAQQAFDAKKYGLTIKAGRRVASRWPYSDYAPQAQYLVGRAYEAEGKDEIAFKSYQKLLEKFPKMTNANEVLQRQLAIADKFLGGKWGRLWGYIPIPPSQDKTVTMYEKVITNAPYSDVAPLAQMKIGAAREKQGDYPSAVKAYEKAADRYAEREQVSAEALYKAGLANLKQSQTAEYDQNAASQAVAAFTDFAALHPDDKRVAESQKKIEELRTEQARGAFNVARFYEHRKKWGGALIYYNEAIIKDPNSKYATEARQRITDIKKRIEAKSEVASDAAKPEAKPESKPAKPSEPATDSK